MKLHQLALCFLCGVSTLLPANVVVVEDHNYFVFDEDLQIKFQVRLRAPLFKNRREDVKFLNPANLNIFYNQKSYWDFPEDSNPVDENNYNPGLMYAVQDAFHHERNKRFGQMDFALGLEHISNGLTGLDSRSLNRYFFSTRLTHPSKKIDLQLKAWNYINMEPEDLDEKWGYGELGTSLYFFGRGCWKGPEFTHPSSGPILTGTMRLGHDNRPGYEVTMTVPMRISICGNEFTPLIVLNYWDGYGERMLTLDERESYFRFGIGFNAPGPKQDPSLNNKQLRLQ